MSDKKLENKKTVVYKHKTVLTREVLTYLQPKPNGVYVDATFGGGGHTRAILAAEPTCKVIAFDWDKKTLDLNAPAFEEEFGDRIQFIWGNFSHISTLLKKNNVKKIDGILADFGTSQFQITQGEGFSFTVDSPLDMRMSAGHYKVTAQDIVNKASEEELMKIFFDFGEERAARKVAKAIVAARAIKTIRTTKQLADIVSTVILPFSRTIHPATKVFQALRIVVNDELNNIKSLLTQAEEVLTSEGRLVCISFHSLEDRIVKQYFKTHENIFENLTKKVVSAAEDELTQNPSSRSAKLRAAIRI